MHLISSERTPVHNFEFEKAVKEQIKRLKHEGKLVLPTPTQLPPGRPKISKKRIDEVFWNMKQVTDAEKFLQDDFLRPGTFDNTCIHEGAHLHYARPLYPDARIIPPSVYYDGVCFVPFWGAIDTVGIDKKCDEQRLLLYVKALWAGPVAEFMHKLANATDDAPLEEMVKGIGDDDDRQNYPIHCAEIRKASPELKFADEEILSRALAQLLADQLTPEVKKEIDYATEEVKASLLAAMYPDEPANASSLGG